MARELALQTLFSVEVGHQPPSEALAQTFTHSGSKGPQRTFIQDLVYGTLEHSDESDRAFSPLLQGWTIDRLPTVDRLLLRMSLFELRHRSQVPQAVVINEAVELAKKFSTEDSGRFINGVLSATCNGSPAKADERQ